MSTVAMMGHRRQHLHPAVASRRRQPEPGGITGDVLRRDRTPAQTPRRPPGGPHANSAITRDPASEASPRPSAVTVIFGLPVVACTRGVPLLLTTLLLQQDQDVQQDRHLRAFQDRVAPRRSHHSCNSRARVVGGPCEKAWSERDGCGR